MKYEDVPEVINLKNWAVVGANTDHDKYGYKIFKKLLETGKNVYPVNPKYDEIDGHKVYNSIMDIPEKIDVVNFVVNPSIGIEVVKQCKEKGVKNIWLQPGTVSDEILNYAKENGINVTEACLLVMSDANAVV